MIEGYYEKVEEVLSSFPEESRKNYYENKKTLEIKNMEIDVPNVNGIYDPEKNIIELKKEDSLPHELFHMAFMNKEKVEQAMDESGDFIYENGIAYRFKTEDGRLIIRGKGLVEGFAEYLSRKCCHSIGHQFLYFFTDLLISIHGEDIINYPLQNDVEGFFEDNRFFDIFKVTRILDTVKDYVNILKRLVRDKKMIEEYMKVAPHEEKIKFSKAILASRSGFQKSIIDSYEVIIDEFENSLNPQISKEDFIIKLTEFLDNPDYNLVLMFDNKEFSLTNEIKTIISEFKQNKQK